MSLHQTITLCFVWSCLIWFDLPAFAQQNSPLPSGAELKALLERVTANVKANEKAAEQYVSDETRHGINLNKKGEVVSEHSDKLECVSIDGQVFMREVERNGKPVTLERQIREQKRLDAMSEQGKGMDLTLEMEGLDPSQFIYTLLPVCCLDSLFDNRVVGHEIINGRDNLVIESTPRPNAIPASEKERTALDWKETTWIDVDDLIPARYEALLLNDKDYLKKGTTERMDFFRQPDTSTNANGSPRFIWLQHSSVFHMSIKVLWVRSSAVSESSYYNYRRFRVDMQVLGDSVQQMSPAQPDREQ